MSRPTLAPYGSWKSPISAALVAKSSVRLGEVALTDDAVFWLEGRAAEGGRSVLVEQRGDGRRRDATPLPFSVRSRVYEYGGGAFAIDGDTIFFSHDRDGRIYRQTAHASPVPITQEGPFRYADLTVDRSRGVILCVCEDHSAPGREAKNSLVAVPVDGSAPPRELASGHDFYATPRLSPDGSKLAWLAWDHPHMPFFATVLYVANCAGDGLVAQERVAGGDNESVVQPLWSPDGVLTFVSDRTDDWNLYQVRAGRTVPLLPQRAEFSPPLWLLGASTYAFRDAERLVAAFCERGIWHLGQIRDLKGTPTLEIIDTPYTDISYVAVRGDQVAFCGGGPAEPRSIVLAELASGRLEVLARAFRCEVDPAYLSAPEPIEFPTEANRTAHGFYYPPKNGDYQAPDGERPPLLVKCHGGPTSATTSSLDLRIQYWTSRGIAVVDVNYGGSTGFGRAYRERLDGLWGVVDVDDCVHAALFLARARRVDETRLLISGGSAGGYTTLAALAFRDVFHAGASHYGISDLETLAAETHKFESHYDARLVGPYLARRDLFRQRSPIHAADRIHCPVVFFQGLEDKVVLPRQSDILVDGLRRRGVPVAYVTFAGEQHGFRSAPNIERALEGELYFYSRVIGFELADAVEPIPIDNLPEPGDEGESARGEQPPS